MTALPKALTELLRAPEETRAQNLREWASAIPGTMRIADLQARQRGRVAGVVTNVRIDPRQGRGAVEATITDGTGEMVARWVGRSSLQGVTLAKGIIMEGVAATGDDGELVFLNPEYDLVSDPEHG